VRVWLIQARLSISSSLVAAAAAQVKAAVVVAVATVHRLAARTLVVAHQQNPKRQ